MPVGLLGRWAPAPIVWTSAAGLVSGAGVSGCAELFAEDGQPSSMEAARALQREQGWAAGEPAVAVFFPDAQQTDVTGSPDWGQAMSSLAMRLAPSEARWSPYYDPTLFQALQAPRSADLRLMMRPVFSRAMAIASRPGEGMLSLFVEDGVCRSDVALVLDVPGPEAVALAAALAPCFDPVFAFDNWPHPRGVVPSHVTLGAALYYLPLFERERSRRPSDAAPMFVLDRQRLAPYSDDSGWFDNRYLAGLPPREALEAAGIRHVLYVVPDGQIDAGADDVNDDLVGLDRAGIDVRLLALSDFSEMPLPGWPEDSATPADPTTPVDPTLLPPPQVNPPQFSLRFFFGGSPRSHACFWDWYGWRGRPTPAATGSAPPIPPALQPRTQFHPTPRPTFTSGSSGWHGAPAGRSGSLGRAFGGGHFGGGHFGGMSG